MVPCGVSLVDDLSAMSKQMAKSMFPRNLQLSDSVKNLPLKTMQFCDLGYTKVQQASSLVERLKKMKS